MKKLVPAALWRRAPSVPANLITPEALPFQEDLEEVIAEPPPPILGKPHLAVATLFVLLITISGLVEVDMIVAGSGRLLSESPAIVLQPLERSIVREINVKPGDAVKKGQVLATLDPTFAGADKASLTAQQKSMIAQLQRLGVEVAGEPLPTSMELSEDPDMVLQVNLYRQRQAQYTSTLASFDGEIANLRAGLRTAQDDRTSLSQQLAVAQDVENLRDELFRGQTGSRLQLLDARSNRLQVDRALQNTTNRLNELNSSLSAKLAQRQSFIDQWQRELLEELVRVRNQAVQIDEALTKAVRISDLVRLTAPQDGIVLEVAKRSAGSVAREAEALISMVPSNVPLLAEITIRSSDVGYTKPGDQVEVKVDAFPFQRHGMLKGKLQSISQESFAANGATEQTDAQRAPLPADSGALHRGRVELLSTELTNLPEGAHLIPGMTVRAEIKVGQRTILSYFLYPITRGFSEAIREP
ncbi:HlyD family type I secretion periplasmic adaptor subunit [Niveispirillum sp. BGYR6]|uniref:HlyD family type I secretion periplasmic adaptor subunit n=1 Tax=Niveispirillum sp. BGYR6 TaxID=2971249 RepID=UPI0022B97D43|nr:HlyD family type I secretion periplasmic adaptor subunit [Niveispirillum sp. BGYR6]MDG5496412.1 HlyD family type I secretion periplasmic adaptor subunit [Niveispirillum sp. BGYR6]